MIHPKRKAFTLVEVLISITLLSLVLMALYRSADILRDSNLRLFKHLEKSNNNLKGSKTLYMDIAYASPNITIVTDEKYHRLTLEHTSHSLYGQGAAKVTWLVAKEENTLLRIEGGKYDIPLRAEQRVEVDVVFKDTEMFKLYKSKKKDKLLCILKSKGSEAQIFMIQNIPLAPVVDKNGTKGRKNKAFNQEKEKIN